MRFIKSALVVVGVAFIILHASFSFAHSPAISNGLSYLQSTQTTEGYWGDPSEVSYNSFLATCVVSESLKYLGGTDVSYSSAVQWINLTNVANNDYLIEKMLSLSLAGNDVTAIRDYLLGIKNSDGGWAVTDGIVSDIKRTALMIQALKAVNYTDYSVLNQSINFLTSSQNPDGGWDYMPAGSSDPIITAIVLRSLSAYNPVFINQDSINKASSYLLTKQNTDGGFGSSPSNVYETALSIMSLIESGHGSTQTIQSGINYLTTSQLPDGSWNDDPYSTALALQALAETRPNLAVSSTGITFSNSMPQSGSTTTISAAIRNTGYDNASNVIVRFYLGDPSAGGVQISTDQIIPFITPNSSTPISVTASFAGTGGKTIFVVVDPDNLISETSKTDNKASARLWVATGPDLAVYSEDMKPSTYVPASGTAFTLNYTVRNLGESASDGFDISLYDGQPSGTPLQTAHISGLNGTEVRTGTFGVTLTGNGNHTLYLVADSGNAITEISKTNNTGSVTVNVGGTVTQADLAVTSADITLTPSRSHAGDTINISANVRNIGAEAANNFTAEIFDGQPEAGGTLIASQTISLNASGSQAISANWAIPAGIHDIVVVLDRTNQIAETNENNNSVRERT